MKICTVCKQEKPLTEFHRFKRGKDGHQSRCKQCQKDIDAKRWRDRGEEIARSLVDRVKIVVQEKTCNCCKQLLPATSFYNRAISEDGLSYTCKTCHYEYNRNWKHLNKEKVQEYQSEYSRNWNLVSKYGITVEDYDRMFCEQNGVCKICSKPETKTNKKTGKIEYLAVDHCHATGKVRGLLCMSCNVTLGRVEDDIGILSKMIKYLQDNNEA